MLDPRPSAKGARRTAALPAELRRASLMVISGDVVCLWILYSNYVFDNQGLSSDRFPHDWVPPRDEGGPRLSLFISSQVGRNGFRMVLSYSPSNEGRKALRIAASLVIK